MTRTKYYHIQLHPEDSNFTVEHIKEILKIGYIGLDFGGNEYYYENENLKLWYQKTEDRKKQILKINIGDVIVVRKGQIPIALTRVIETYEFEPKAKGLAWFRHRVRVEILSFYDEFIEYFKGKKFIIKQSRGTLWLSKNSKTDTYRAIDYWYKNRPVNISKYLNNEIISKIQKNNIVFYDNKIKYSNIEKLFSFDTTTLRNIKIKLSNVKSVTELEFELNLQQDVYAIIGENGIGKSSLLIGLGRLLNGNILRYELKGDIFNDSKIEYLIEDKIYTFERENVTDKLNKTTRRWIETSKKEQIEDFEIFPFPKFEGFFESSIISGSRFEHLEIKKEILEFVDKYNRKSTNIEKTIVDSFIAKNLDYIINGNTTGKYDNIFILNYKNKDVYYKLENEHLISEYSFSTGEYFVLTLLKLLLKYKNNNQSLIIIDEIDISLHPKAQKRLVEKLKFFAKKYNLTILIATHSLQIIDSIDANNLYLAKNSDGKVTFSQGKQAGYISSFLYHKVVYDKILLVEDNLAKMFTEKIIENINEFKNCLYTVVPIGGWEKVLEIASIEQAEKFFSGDILVILDGDVKNNDSFQKKKNNYKNVNYTFLPIENVEDFIANILIAQNHFQEKIKTKYLKQTNFEDLDLTIDSEYFFDLKNKFSNLIKPTKEKDKLIANFTDFIDELFEYKEKPEGLISENKKGNPKTVVKKLKSQIMKYSTTNDEKEFDNFFIEYIVQELEKDKKCKNFLYKLKRFVK